MADDKKLKFMKLTCWIGTIADFLWAIALVMPSLYGFLIGKPGFDPDAGTRSIMGIGATLMLAWSILLIWVQKKPIERRAVLLMTAYPITTALFLTSCLSIYFGSTPLIDGLWILTKTLILTILFTASYIFARQLAHKNYQSMQG